MSILLNFRFPGGWYFWNCDNTELKISSKIFFFYFQTALLGGSGLTTNHHEGCVNICYVSLISWKHFAAKDADMWPHDPFKPLPFLPVNDGFSLSRVNNLFRGKKTAIDWFSVDKAQIVHLSRRVDFPLHKLRAETYFTELGRHDVPKKINWGCVFEQSTKRNRSV